MTGVCMVNNSGKTLCGLRDLGKDSLQRDDKIISGNTVAYGVRSRLLCGFLTAQ